MCACESSWRCDEVSVAACACLRACIGFWLCNKLQGGTRVLNLICLRARLCLPRFETAHAPPACCFRHARARARPGRRSARLRQACMRFRPAPAREPALATAAPACGRHACAFDRRPPASPPLPPQRPLAAGMHALSTGARPRARPGRRSARLRQACAFNQRAPALAAA